MSRTYPQVPEWPQNPNNQLAELTLSLKLLTPMFGGGYEAGEVDEECLVRAASVRGQLRFWWRALYGGGYSSPKLFEAEEALWGSSEKPGKISLTVQVSKEGQTKSYSEIITDSNRSSLKYLLFPFQENKKENKPEAKGREEVEFTLRVVFPQDKQCQVENTLKAWLAFGGIGARTRRGCGALTVTKDQEKWLPPSDKQKLEEWMKEWRKKLPQLGSSPLNFTLLSGGRAVVGALKPLQQAMEVWVDLAEYWQEFRKGLVNSGKWQDYQKLIVLLKNPQQNEIELGKPYLGLPIIYQSFKRKAQFAGEITPAEPESGRMASPVILKPIALQSDKVAPLVLILSAPEPRKVEIKPVNSKLSLSCPKHDPVLQQLKASDPLDAALKFAKKRFAYVDISL